jgi:hypothetical protein
MQPPIDDYGSLAELARKRVFRDAHDRRAYFRALLVARKLVLNPALVACGRAYLERFVKPDPHQRRAFDLWSATLDLPVEEIVGRLLADDARGASLRETAPVFEVISAAELRALIAAA